MNHVLSCAGCGAKNRVSSVPAGQVPTCARCGAALPWLHDGTDATFAQDIRAAVPVLVDFWAPWCGPCRTVAPVLEDLAREQAGRLRVVKVNVDDNPQAPGLHGVQGIPTLILFQDGQPVERMVGALPRAQLMAKLAPLLERGARGAERRA